MALDAAGRSRTGISIQDLLDLLPDEDPRSDREVRDWWVKNAPPRALADSAASGPQLPPYAAGCSERARRGATYLSAARVLVNSDLEVVGPMLRFVGVTGSTAYGEPEAGDDCDFMVVVRQGAVWPFLAYTLLRLRAPLRANSDEGPSSWCFNYVVDEESMRGDFARPRGFLFAREALITRPILGEAYYRSLLQSAPWLRAEVPRLLARWETVEPAPPVSSVKRSILVSALNALLFPLMATYLQLKSLKVNHDKRRDGRPEECFRTITGLGRMALVTTKFDRLTTLYGPATAVPPES